MRIEKNWQPVELTAMQGGVPIDAGWYVTEFNIQGSIQHVPEIVVEDNDNKEVRRSLIGFHSGRNRMLIYLPTGRITAYDKALQFDFLSRVSELEGRARVLLISFRYLMDFFSIKLLFRIIAMQFQNRFELSTDLLQFYFPKNYLYEIQRWNRLKGFAWILNWLTRGVSVAVLIEDESQRRLLLDQLVPADQIVLAGDGDVKLDEIDYLLPLAKTERLREPAIAMIKRAVKQSKKAPAMLYSDHDYSSTQWVGQDNGQQPQGVMEPVLKPQASLAYLHCFNYVGPATVFATDYLQANNIVALLSDEERYRLCIELFQKEGGAHHIPEALFVSDRAAEKQQYSTSTPAPNSQSAWPNIEWQRRADYNVLTASPNWQERPSVDLIIPTRDGLDVLKPCVQSILEITDYPNFSIYLVDNNSELPETKQYLQEIALHDQVTVIDFPGEFNYSAINNLAVAQGSSDYIALINNDVEVIHADWLTQMMVWASQDNVGIVGAKLLFGNGKVQHAGVTIGMGNAAGHIHRLADGDSLGYQNRLVATQNMMAVTAACLLTPRKLFENVGGLDEEFLKVAYNDIDYCLTVEKLGMEIIWTPEATLYHHESVSRGDDMSEQHIERYLNEVAMLQKRWKTKGFVDKYYSKHLRINDEGVFPQVFLSDSGQMLRLDNPNLQE